jgi:Delta3-Delta2-enoyl-CoA isomerase
MTVDRQMKNEEILIKSLEDGILTLSMNTPRHLNGWTMPMMDALKTSFHSANLDEEVKVVILTGVGHYYCAGVNLGATLKLGHPQKIRAQIIAHNQALFDAFITLSKPIIVAINGHAIGASVTSATLCDAIISVKKATFSTPFAALGITPEGCSSVMFTRLMGEETAQRILGDEGWKPTAEEAAEIGLINTVVDEESLTKVSRQLALEWIGHERGRQYRGGLSKGALLEINAKESIDLADAFLSSPFIKAQFSFLFKKKKYMPACLFACMLISRPLWARLL